MNATQQLEADGWQKAEPGRWTHPRLGGICQAQGGSWRAYPLRGAQHGPYKTATAAALALNGAQEDGR